MHRGLSRESLMPNNVFHWKGLACPEFEKVLVEKLANRNLSSSSRRSPNKNTKIKQEKGTTERIMTAVTTQCGANVYNSNISNHSNPGQQYRKRVGTHSLRRYRQPPATSLTPGGSPTPAAPGIGRGNLVVKNWSWEHGRGNCGVVVMV